MRVAILDDWFDTLRTLPCFERLEGHEVTVFTDHVQDTDGLAERLQGFEGLVLIRERTEIRAPERVEHARHPRTEELGHCHSGAERAQQERPYDEAAPTGPPILN